ncbi:hypothetical protein Fmac_020636 [Flemingia macrophylla]|uniref:Uncharacterized protein n=1 Tax=Flemingia macrophylla TaxID=520843 RepID=A0ABD1LUL9_9FABA
MRGGRKSIHAITTWVRRQPPKVKAFLAVVSGMAALVLLRFIVHHHDNLFVAAEAVYSLGISVLIYKLIKEKTCADLSELTAMFLAVRLYCSFIMEYDIHTLVDLATLATTLWVIYMIRFKLKSSYMEEKDNFAIYYVIVEPFTAHYVFALGVARFLSCAHWVLQVLDSRGHLLVALSFADNVLRVFQRDSCPYDILIYCACDLLRQILITALIFGSLVELEDLYNESRSNCFVEHVLGIMEEKKTQENLSGKISKISLIGTEQLEKFLLNKLDVYESVVGDSNVKCTPRIAGFPPAFQAISRNPIVLDLAYNMIEFPPIENRMKKDRKVKGAFISRIFG